MRKTLEKWQRNGRFGSKQDNGQQNKGVTTMATNLKHLCRALVVATVAATAGTAWAQKTWTDTLTLTWDGSNSGDWQIANTLGHDGIIKHGSAVDVQMAMYTDPAGSTPRDAVLVRFPVADAFAEIQTSPFLEITVDAAEFSFRTQWHGPWGQRTYYVSEIHIPWDETLTWSQYTSGSGIRYNTPDPLFTDTTPEGESTVWTNPEVDVLSTFNDWTWEEISDRGWIIWTFNQGPGILRPDQSLAAMTLTIDYTATIPEPTSLALLGLGGLALLKRRRK